MEKRDIVILILLGIILFLMIATAKEGKPLDELTPAEKRYYDELSENYDCAPDPLYGGCF